MPRLFIISLMLDPVNRKIVSSKTFLLTICTANCKALILSVSNTFCLNSYSMLVLHTTFGNIYKGCILFKIF